MKNIIVALVLLAVGSTPVVAQIDGNWKDQNSGGIVNIYHKGGKYFGVAISGGNAKDEEELKGKKVFILNDFSKDGKNTWCCGKIFEPWKKITADGNLELISKDTLKVTGRVLIFSEVHIWTRSK